MSIVCGSRERPTAACRRPRPCMVPVGSVAEVRSCCAAQASPPALALNMHYIGKPPPQMLCVLARASAASTSHRANTDFLGAFISGSIPSIPAAAQQCYLWEPPCSQNLPLWPLARLGEPSATTHACASLGMLASRPSWLVRSASRSRCFSCAPADSRPGLYVEPQNNTTNKCLPMSHTLPVPAC